MILFNLFPFIFGLFLLFTSISADDIPDEYRCLADIQEFDATTPGTVSSPFYGKREYHNNLNCHYRISAPEGYRIKITFKDLDLVPSRECNEDKIKIMSKDRNEELGIFCGSDIPNPILSKEGENEIMLLFESDFMMAGRGFLIYYESSPYFTSVCENGYIECLNRNCYTNSQKCDGIDNCGDGTDEEKCGRVIENFPEDCSVQEIKPNTVFTEGADRMVGGEEVIPNSWPWQVSLRSLWSDPAGHFCGGTLVNAQWVLTAAHCVANFRHPGEMKIVVGAHNKYKKTQYEQVRRSTKIITYPDIEGDELLEKFDILNDLTLVKLSAPVTFNKGVQPACLPSQGSRAEPGWNCYATGWGETRGTGTPESLKQMELVVQPHTNCQFYDGLQICVEKRNNSPCHGDSGGPLHCRVNDKWYVYGAASYVTTVNFLGGICTGPGAMTVYVSVAEKADWIRSTINKYS